MTEQKPKPVISAAAASTPSSKPQQLSKPVSPKVDLKSPVKSYIDPDQADNIGPQVKINNTSIIQIVNFVYYL